MKNQLNRLRRKLFKRKETLTLNMGLTVVGETGRAGLGEMAGGSGAAAAGTGDGADTVEAAVEGSDLISVGVDGCSGVVGALSSLLVDVRRFRFLGSAFDPASRASMNNELSCSAAARSRRKIGKKSLKFTIFDGHRVPSVISMRKNEIHVSADLSLFSVFFHTEWIHSLFAIK